MLAVEESCQLKNKSAKILLYSGGQAKCPFQFTAYRPLTAHNFGMIFSWNIVQRVFDPKV